MAHLLETKFSAYSLNEQEAQEGSKFTVTQKQVIQNHIASLADELLLLEPDPNNYSDFIQKQACTKGGIDALTYLLACGEAIEQAEKESMDFNSVNKGGSVDYNLFNDADQ